MSHDERWSQTAVARRYARLAKARRATEWRDLEPREPDKEGSHWVFTPVNRIVEGIEANDPVCRELGVELLEDDQDIPFASILRSNTAKALRRGDLPDALKQRLRARILALLIRGEVAPEFKQYAKLLNAVGVTRAELDAVESKLDRSNEFVMRWFHYLRNNAS